MVIDGSARPRPPAVQERPVKNPAASPVSSSIMVLLASCLWSAGCLSKAPQYEEPVNPNAAGGTGGALGMGSGGAPGSLRSNDGPDPGGAGGTAGVPGTGGAAGFSCEPASPCVVPGKPCVVGATVCEGTSATCAETTRLQANGSPCGLGNVCLDGICSTCQAGLECPLPSANPCKLGSIECGTGRPECTEAGNAPNGTTCGQGMVCRDGACTACQAGDSCVPANPCHDGTLDCTGGPASTCKDSGQEKPAGSQCGANKVCGPTGECVACTAGMACELPDGPCKLGKLECSTGVPVCVASGNAPNGKACGSGRVCREGSCETCGEGMPCAPENKCHSGTLSCSSGTPVCRDTGVNLRNGTECGTNRFCSNGSCAACTPNMPCTPDNNPCRVGRTSCETGTSQCMASGDQPNGRACGNGRACQAGSCVECGGQGQPCCGNNCDGGARCSGGNVVTPFCDTGICRERMSDACNSCEECRGSTCEPKRCGADEVCRNGSCVLECGSRVNCNGVCIPPTQPCNGDCRGLRRCGNTCVDGDCCADADCGQSCRQCRNNRCVDTPNNQGGRLCEGGAACVENGSRLRLDAFCLDGNCIRDRTQACSYRGCENGRCRNECPDGMNDTGANCEPCGDNVAGQTCCKRGRPCRDDRLICAVSRDACGRCGGCGEPCCGSEFTSPNRVDTSPDFGSCFEGTCFDLGLELGFQCRCF
jgi:hypothetical protein